MTMEKKIKRYKGIFLLWIVMSFGVQIFYLFRSDLQLSLLNRIILFIIQIISIVGYVHFYLYDQSDERRKDILKKTHWLVFVIYCLNLIYVLFLDPHFGRHMTSQAMTFHEYLKQNVNLHLFDSIRLFIHGYEIGVVSLETLLRNILGNIVVFMPMGYFLPALFKNQRKMSVFLVTLVIMILCVESIQVLLRIGSGDIDDLMLNMIGGIIMFIVFKCYVVIRKGK